MKISETNLAYLAGIIDSEGTITMIKKLNHNTAGCSYSLQIFISSTDKLIIDWIYEITGLGNVSEAKLRNKKSKKSWRWYAWCNQASQFVKSIIPYLIIKKPNAELAIEFQSRVSKSVNIKLSQDDLEFRSKAYATIHNYNVVGLGKNGRFADDTKNFDTSKFNKKKIICSLTENEKSYLAGFVDGDGCITVTKKKCKDGTITGISFRLNVIISNTNKDVLDWICDLTGLGSIYKYSKQKNPNQADAWKLVLWSNQAAQLINAILPYLKIKKERAILALEFQNSSKYTNKLSESDRLFQIEKHIAFRNINKRGSDLCPMVLSITQI